MFMLLSPSGPATINVQGWSRSHKLEAGAARNRSGPAISSGVPNAPQHGARRQPAGQTASPGLAEKDPAPAH